MTSPHWQPFWDPWNLYLPYTRALAEKNRRHESYFSWTMRPLRPSAPQLNFMLYDNQEVCLYDFRLMVCRRLAAASDVKNYRTPSASTLQDAHPRSARFPLAYPETCNAISSSASSCHLWDRSQYITVFNIKIFHFQDAVCTLGTF